MHSSLFHGGHDISIHAPAKGATPIISHYVTSLKVFQSTLPRRERQERPAARFSSFLFQSTLPRRERPGRLKRPEAAWKFQSTLPRRERPVQKILPSLYPQFQSTLPRRERLDSSTVVRALINFNPRSREGSDFIEDYEKTNKIISIHAPAKGATIRDDKHGN